MEKRKTATSTAVKNRYNAKTYDSHVFRVRKGSPLAASIAAYKAENPQGFSELVKSLLEKHFGGGWG
ncbi:MAG: hypothetical protein LBI54_05680 [Lachnospiraceae bacterium]|jgi:hypothetical protein|nr:hypothetical protein [Lachnospiraceae bacterium]